MIELKDLLRATAGHVHGPVHATRFAGFCHDPREVTAGQLFVAVRTGWADGHDDALDACRGGARGVLCERPIDLEGLPITTIVVPDTLSALADWARLVLKERQVEVVGVTGSAGKTTTKEAAAAVLGLAQPVFKSPGDRGGRLELSIALGQLQPQQHLAVLEMPCNSPGEMGGLVRIAAPRHGVVLNVSAAHADTLGAREAVAGEVERLVAALPADGWAVLNCDDSRVAAMATCAAAQVLWIGLDERADVRASDLRAGERGLTFSLSARGASVPVASALMGRHHVYALLASAALGLIYGLPLEQVAVALASLAPLPGRLRPLASREGSLILDDSYSATPDTVEAALATLAGLPQRHKVAVLGDMAWLGASEAEAHREAGARAAAVADALVTCGERMRLAAEEAACRGLARERIHVTYTAGDALRAVEDELGPDAAVLVTGSAGQRLEQVVQGLLPEGTQPAQHLVRRGLGWRAGCHRLPPRPTWLEIDLEAIAHNVRELCRIAGRGVAVMAVVKADGYGHGAIKVARTALNNGARWLGVACLGEALALREVEAEVPILVLGYTPPWQARQAVERGIDTTVYSLETAAALSRAGLELGRPARVHVKVDTGMGRLGLLPGQAPAFISTLRDMPGLTVQGLFTHFATADHADRSHCNEQLRRLKGLLLELEAQGLRPPLVHAANSAATLTMPEAHLDMVRVGIALYGLNPSAEVPCPPSFRPALAFKTLVAQVKTLPPGSCVSYGCTYRTQGEERIAVIPVGYADGFRRAPQHWGHVLVRGVRAPIVGRVCMDQTMVNVTGIPGVRQGDEVVLIGAQGRERITVDDVAARLGTINYEVVSEILARVPRVS